MAADQWRKRLHSTNIVGCYGREQHRTKRKNTGLSQYDSNIRSHISLEWDGNHKRVIARKEQIGINWRDLKPFFGSSPHGSNIIADVCAVPPEIYELENIKEVLSYEVWETCLSESERNHLMQFLPRDQEAEKVLKALLAGDNFHFGSPFLNWGASLCSGDLHPDAICQRDQHLKTEKKAYYTELHKYHNNMIESLVKLKERFHNCKDPEKEIVQKIQRSKNDMEKRNSLSANDSRFRVLEGNVAASSESCSWVADEKACSSDNQNSFMVKGGNRKNRVHEKGSLNGGSPSIVSDDVLDVGTKFKKGEKRQHQNVLSNDGAMYMSYFKISKKQHDIVKNMKQSGKSIQSRSLNRVLGNLNSFNVQPYEVFIQEEQKKLREYWMQLATKALPAAFANWRDLHSQRSQMRMSLEQEINEKFKMLTQDDEDRGSHESALQDHIEIAEDLVPALEHAEKSVSGSPGQQSLEHFVSGSPEQQSQEHFVSGFPEQQSQEHFVSGSPEQQSQEHFVSDSPEQQSQEHFVSGSPEQQSQERFVSGSPEQQSQERFVSGSPEQQSQERFVSGSPEQQSQEHFVSGQEVNSTDSDSGEHIVSKSDHVNLNPPEYSGVVNTADVATSQGVQLSCNDDVWPARNNISHSYYDSTATHEYASDDGLSIVHPKTNDEQKTHLIDLESSLGVNDGKKTHLIDLESNLEVNDEQKTHLIDLESNLGVGDTEKDMVHRQSEGISFRQSDDGSFGSYSNLHRNELFQSVFKGQGVLSYHHQQKPTTGLDFQSANSMLVEGDQFAGHFQEQSHPSLPVEQRQKRESDVYQQQRPHNLSANLYPDGGRFLIPRQEQLAPVHMHDWAVNGVPIPPPPIQTNLNGGDLHNWFPGEHRARGGWTGSGGASVPSQSMGSVSGEDQSLFSVLSQCNQLHSSSPYHHSMPPSNQFITSRTYEMMGRATPAINNVLPQSSHSLDYMSGREAATSSLMPDDIGWIGLPPHQSSSLQDPMGKPYLRSWNQ
ncbi:uncharacterized protein LOC133816970 [Humulus lupulus]|uniref:uncharacterized protein LOC133816970 n=1 Tax=Humulus lupulus TaxID=3486 RepID=UPI002B4078C7|nr:uncharacterized protein LOC133816970 [Humulus lupulus]XP_062105317.1 uncharacterized protein LOC133816970 [Humulus lupulus]